MSDGEVYESVNPEDTMYERRTINLGNFLLTLSDAIDQACPELAQHQVRTAFVAWELARHMGLPDTEVQRIFGAALLHDVGALSPEEKLALHKGGDVDTEIHCRRGELLLTAVPKLRAAAPLVRHHHTPWSRWADRIDRSAVLGSQILRLADEVERRVDRDVYVLHQSDEITRSIRKLSGTEVHPEVVDAFRALTRREEFWLDLTSPRLYSLLLHRGPFRKLEVELLDLAPIGELFRNIVDFRSAFTATHSSGVAACASEMAGLFGLTRTECRLVEMAGNLHDLGKLVIPSKVLDKPGDLSAEESALFKQHTYFTYSVLDTVAGMQPIVEWASFHHERLDGSGYPFHRSAEDLDTGARIMAVADVFTALAEDRPYRKGLGQDQVSAVLRLLSSKQALDSRLVDLALDNYRHVWKAVRDRQDAIRHIFEMDYAPLGRHRGLAEAV